MSLRAPLAVVVEIRADDRRWFRLSRNIGSDGIGLARAVPIETGRPVQLSFTLPLAPDVAPARGVAAGVPSTGDATAADANPLDADEGRLSLRAELSGEEDQASDDAGGVELAFIDPPLEVRRILKRYLKERLGLHLK